MTIHSTESPLTLPPIAAIPVVSSPSVAPATSAASSPLTVVTACVTAYDDTHTGETRKILADFSAFCFVNVSVRLFIVTSTPADYFAKLAHHLFLCRDSPRPIFSYSNFHQVDIRKLGQLREKEEAWAHANRAAGGRGTFLELHIVHVDASEGIAAPFHCHDYLMPYVTQQPQTAENYFVYLEDDVDFTITHFLSFQQEYFYLKSLGYQNYIVHNFIRYDHPHHSVGMEASQQVWSAPDVKYANALWIIGNRLYFTTDRVYAAGWLLHRDQIVYLHQQNMFLSRRGSFPFGRCREEVAGIRLFVDTVGVYPYYDAGAYIHHMPDKHWVQQKRHQVVIDMIEHVEEKIRCILAGRDCESRIRVMCPSAQFLEGWLDSLHRGPFSASIQFSSIPECQFTEEQRQLLRQALPDDTISS